MHGLVNTTECQSNPCKAMIMVKIAKIRTVWLHVCFCLRNYHLLLFFTFGEPVGFVHFTPPQQPSLPPPHTHTQSHTSMSILLSIFHVQLLCYGNRRRLAMGWLLTADFRSFSLFSPAVLLLALNALLTHSCLLIPSQSLHGVHSMISVIIPCLLAPRPTVIPSVLPHFFVLPSSLRLLTVCLRKCNCCGGPP